MIIERINTSDCLANLLYKFNIVVLLHNISLQHRIGLPDNLISNSDLTLFSREKVEETIVYVAKSYAPFIKSGEPGKYDFNGALLAVFREMLINNIYNVLSNSFKYPTGKLYSIPSYIPVIFPDLEHSTYKDIVKKLLPNVNSLYNIYKNEYYTITCNPSYTITNSIATYVKYTAFVHPSDMIVMWKI